MCGEQVNPLSHRTDKYFAPLVNVIFFFFLNSADTQIKLDDLFLFLTGCQQMPVGGIDKKIGIHFKNDCQENCTCFPIVSLCALTLTLPLHIKPAQIFEVLEEAVQSSVGFGRL